MTEPSAAALVRAVIDAIDAAEAELAAMPFFVRPMVKRGLASRTGRSFADWRRDLAAAAAAIARGGDAAAVRRADDALVADLERLADNFRGAPERARRGMGNDPRVAAEVQARADVRDAATRALLSWLRA
ncbi:MAG: hypothetical protein H6709_11520 [Kofleriaceae bacterium]|nr:hypothetical protein [Kofleriaceae bacterium]MCB9572704.1 hypothetical protein [Kofleriaceae bacterium]